MKKKDRADQDSDRELGMHRQIDRRDFLQGTAIAIMGAISGVAPELVAAAELAAQCQALRPRTRSRRTLVDPDEGLPLKTARAQAGAISIANADSGGGAYTDVAIDQAHRAVSELLG